MSDSRLEKFIYAICSMDVTDLPVPLSRIEKLWNCLITGETPDFEPLSRNEKYLMVMLDRYDISNLPAPMSQGEKLLYKIAVGETDLSDVPGYLSRYEELLKYLIENGGISGGDFEYVLYTLNQSLYTLYTTAEKPVKSAILSGQTLVSIYDGYKPINQMSTELFFKVSQELKENTKYMILSYDFLFTKGGYRQNTWEDIVDIHTELTNKFIFTTSSPVDFKHGYLNGTIELTTEEKKDAKIVLLEYQDGMENWDIPYFTGMQSVKLPVLTTTGKNLFDGIWSTTDIAVGGENIWCENYIEVNSNATYYYSRTLNGSGWNCTRQYDADFNLIKESNMGFTGGKITLEPNTKYIKIATKKIYIDEPLMISVTKEEGYEPFKSNILTVNEDVVLRGVGDVQDTLDCLTGELTQRIGEIVLDGMEEWNVSGHSNWTSCYTKTYVFPHLVNNGTSLISDKMISHIHYDYLGSRDLIGISLTKEGYVSLKYLPNGSKPQPSEVSDYLKSNPITIQYPLETESIKTVDLTVVDQDNQPTQLGTFENVTHVSLESAGLIPEVKMEVATHISKELASASPLMDDISTKQEQLNTTVDEQSNNVDATMIATTEIYEETL